MYIYDICVFNEVTIPAAHTFPYLPMFGMKNACSWASKDSSHNAFPWDLNEVFRGQELGGGHEVSQRGTYSFSWRWKTGCYLSNI